MTGSTGFAYVVFGRQSLPDVAMIFLLGVVVVAMRFSFWASLLTALLSVLSYDFFFIPPYLSFTVDDGRDIITFVVMFIVGVVISTLTRRIRQQAEVARARADRTERLYALSRELSSTRAPDRLGEVATRHLHEFFEGDVTVLLPDASGQLAPGAASEGACALQEDDHRAAAWAFQHDEPAGAGAQTEAGSKVRFVPLHGSHGRVGVLGVVAHPEGRFADPEQRQILDTFAAQIVSALDRARIAGEAEAARLEAESERLQSSLLSSVSHDLRTPLAVITGAASTLLGPSPVDPASQLDLVGAIYDESVRLTRLVGNLLDMTRLTAGVVKVNKEWQPIEAVVGPAIRRMEDKLAGRPLHVQVPSSLPLVPFDAVLVEQVLLNLLENAGKYAPPDAPISVDARTEGTGRVVFEVADRGPGVPDADKRRIFDKFYRVPGGPARGAGLGLAICRGIAEAHGGHIEVLDREGGGALFRFSLPIEGSPPAVEPEGETT